MFGLARCHNFLQTIFTANHAKYANRISFAWFAYFAVAIPALKIFKAHHGFNHFTNHSIAARSDSGFT